jgi:hypothetical protein
MLIRYDDKASALDIKILKLDGIRRWSDLPIEYLGGTPTMAKADDGTVWIGTCNREGEEEFYEIREGDMINRPVWTGIIIPAIEEAGRRLGEIMKANPREKNDRIVTLVI